MKASQSFLAFQILKEMVLWKTYKGQNILILHSGLGYTGFTHTGEQGGSDGSPARSQKHAFSFPCSGPQWAGGIYRGQNKEAEQEGNICPLAPLTLQQSRSPRASQHVI